MQLFAQMLLAGWHDLLGWVAIVAGIALAVHTLGFGQPAAGAAHILRAYRPAEWSARQAAHERTRPLDPASQLERVVAVAESGFARIASVADLHALAAQELEAVDDAVMRLLEDFAPNTTLSISHGEVGPGPAPAAKPLAA